MFSSKNCDKISAAFDSPLHLIFHFQYKTATKSFARARHFRWNVYLSLDTLEIFRLIYILENVRITKRKHFETASKSTVIRLQA